MATKLKYVIEATTNYFDPKKPDDEEGYLCESNSITIPPKSPSPDDVLDNEVSVGKLVARLVTQKGIQKLGVLIPRSQVVANADMVHLLLEAQPSPRGSKSSRSACSEATTAENCIGRS